MVGDAGDLPQAGRDRLPGAVGEAGREWIRSKPFGHDPRYTARLLIDFGHVVQLLELHAGVSLVELGCGSGWMSRLAARQGVHVEGYDIAPQMIEIARARPNAKASTSASKSETTSSWTSAAASTRACSTTRFTTHLAADLVLASAQARAEARRETAPRRAELEAPLPGPPGHRRVRRHGVRLLVEAA